MIQSSETLKNLTNLYWIVSPIQTGLSFTNFMDETRRKIVETETSVQYVQGSNARHMRFSRRLQTKHCDESK